MDHAIEVTHLSKRYGDAVAVIDISFAVAPGEVFCLLGPNGAGKTTTTEILEGFRERTGGEVRVLGHDPGHHERALRERVGIVLQECGVQDDLTVAEVVDLYARYTPRRLPTAQVLDLVELDAKATDRVKHLSGGQRRRLDVALALVGDPDVVFLDEPTTGFDPAARRASWSMVKNLGTLGKTVLLTTHFMDEAEALADRIAVVVGGRVVAEGTPATLGGRDRAPSTITCTLPVGPLVPPPLPASLVTMDGPVLRAVTTDATAALHALTTWSLTTATPLTGLAVTQPSLEDVYLELTATAVDTRPQESVR
jgi:ABC-2 type transport system ATP-binding protein